MVGIGIVGEFIIPICGIRILYMCISVYVYMCISKLGYYYARVKSLHQKAACYNNEFL